MGVETELDRVALLTTHGDGEAEAVPSGDRFPILFDNPYEGILSGDVEVAGRSPTMMTTTAIVTLLNIQQGGFVSFQSVVYGVASVEDDGTGMSTLRLER